MEQRKNAYYKSPVAAMSSFVWMCCKEPQKKGHLALNNQEPPWSTATRIFRHLYFSAKTADRMRAQMSGISGHVQVREEKKSPESSMLSHDRG